MVTLTSATSEETRAIAARIAAHLKSGDVILLYGDLGAGKTTFTQGLAEALGVREPVTSPTFTLVQEYAGKSLRLYHFDAYRLDSPEQVADLGFSEYLERGGVVVVEWADRLDWLAPPDALHIRIAPQERDRRLLNLTATGPRSSDLLAALRGQ